MKTYIIAAAALLLASCNSQEASKEALLLQKAGPNIEAYMKQDMHDPASLSIEYSSVPLLLDTIRQEDVFKAFRDCYLIRANCRGNNPLGASVLNTYVFYVTEDGRVRYSQPYEELTPEEQSWISEASVAALTQPTGT